MILECPHCQTRYTFDEDRFERKPSKKIRCARCQKVFGATNPAFAAPPPVVNPDETTFRGKSPRPQRTTRKRAGAMTADLSLPEGIRYAIAIINGPDAGQVFRIESPRAIVGRVGSDIVLTDSESSREHAVIEVRDHLVTLVDLESTNGTMIDGAKITEPMELTNHSEFQIGTTTLMLIQTEDV